MDWHAIVTRWKSSIIHLVCDRYVGNIIQAPYANFPTEKYYGSGFIIDTDNGWVLTSASLVQNALYIRGCSTVLRDGNNLALTLIAINDQTQMALCQLELADLERIKRSIERVGLLNMQIADSLQVRDNAPLLILYYTANMRLKYVETQLREAENISYTNTYQINSYHSYSKLAHAKAECDGAPVLNADGNVVGIVSSIDDKMYFFSLRLLLAIWPDFIKESIISLPDVAIDWTPCNPDLSQHITNTDTTGIMVSRIWSNSLFHSMKPNDILFAINFQDNYWACQNNSLPDMIDDETGEIKPSGCHISAVFDNQGYLTLYEKKDNNIVQPPLLLNKLTIYQVWDLIPLHSKFDIILYRGNQLSRLYITKSRRKEYIIPRLYLHFQKLVYHIIAGLCIVPLVYNHYEYFKLPHLHKYVTGKRRYKNYLIIVDKFISTQVYTRTDIKVGDIIGEINGERVSSMDELVAVVRKTRQYLTIRTRAGSYYMITLENLLHEDKDILETYDITEYEHILDP